MMFKTLLTCRAELSQEPTAGTLQLYLLLDHSLEQEYLIHKVTSSFCNFRPFSLYILNNFSLILTILEFFSENVLQTKQKKFMFFKPFMFSVSSGDLQIP